jgi:hypothetical protein
MTDKKRLNPYTRRGLIQARVDNEEMQSIITKALVYCKGDVSKFIRMACLNYRPVKNTKAGK